jgi:aspartate carbamoyltransferase catalytic subunit
MRHLIGIEHLSAAQLLQLLESAESMVEISSRELKKVPALRGKTIVNFFFEASTRTRTSFEIAAKRLSADVINLSVATSSVSKGETLFDTARTLEAMAPDVIVVRHASGGVPDFLARVLSRVSIVNAGDGMREHPTQALLDCLTLKQHFAATRKLSGTSAETSLLALSGLKVAIVGDVLHSRVARSNVWAHLLLGNEVRLVGPATLLPKEFQGAFIPSTDNKLPLDGAGKSIPRGTLRIVHSLEEGLAGADVVMCLRVQTERLQQFFLPTLEEYSRTFGVSEKVLAKVAPRAVVLHPGPANRGIEVSSEVIDGPRSLVRNQVSNGIAVRMAVLFHVCTGSEEVGVQGDQKSQNTNPHLSGSHPQGATQTAGAQL